MIRKFDWWQRGFHPMWDWLCDWLGSCWMTLKVPFDATVTFPSVFWQQCERLACRWTPTVVHPLLLLLCFPFQTLRVQTHPLQCGPETRTNSKFFKDKDFHIKPHLSEVKATNCEHLSSAKIQRQQKIRRLCANLKVPHYPTFPLQVFSNNAINDSHDFRAEMVDWSGVISVLRV